MAHALVIGGASGIGAGMAQVFYKRGFELIIGDINPAATDFGRQFIVDATNQESVLDLYSEVSRLTDALDVLAITIGAIDESSIINQPQEKWRWMFDVNFFAVVHVVDTFLPLIRKSPAGRIMLTCAAAAFATPQAGMRLGLYAVSKAALMAYYKALRLELAAEQIHVSVLVPTRIKGRLAENSAIMRSQALAEDFDDHKGRQPEIHALSEAAACAEQFVDELLAGQPLITNDAAFVSQKMSEGYNEVADLLTSRKERS